MKYRSGNYDAERYGESSYLANGDKMTFELTFLMHDRVSAFATVKAHRMIIKDGTYQFQNNTNTSTLEGLQKKFRNPDAVSDLIQPSWRTIYYYPVNKFKVEIIDEDGN